MTLKIGTDRPLTNSVGPDQMISLHYLPYISVQQQKVVEWTI